MAATMSLLMFLHVGSYFATTGAGWMVVSTRHQLVERYYCQPASTPTVNALPGQGTSTMPTAGVLPWVGNGCMSNRPNRVHR
jgi:hypothetical protein